MTVSVQPTTSLTSVTFNRESEQLERNQHRFEMQQGAAKDSGSHAPDHFENRR
jgi:hypothetical protein